MAERIFLLTRDFAAASRLQNQLNYKSVIFPLSKTEKLTVSLADLNDYDAIIMTSQNALQIKDLDFWQNINRKQKFYIVGDNFAAKLKAAAINNFAVFESVQVLAKKLATKQRQKYLYLRGDKISYELRAILGEQVTERICYETNYFPIERNELFEFVTNNQVTDLLFISKFNAERFRGLLDDKLDYSKYRIYCFSERIAELFADYAAQVIIPKKPTMLELLKIL